MVAKLIKLIYDGQLNKLTDDKQIEKLKIFFEENTPKKTNSIEWYRTVPFINELIKIQIEYTEFLYTETLVDEKTQSDSLFMLKNTNIQHNAEFIKLLTLICSLWGIDWQTEFKINALGSANNSMHKSIDKFEQEYPEIKIDRFYNHNYCKIQYFICDSNKHYSVNNNLWNNLSNYTESRIITTLVY